MTARTARSSNLRPRTAAIARTAFAAALFAISFAAGAQDYVAAGDKDVIFARKVLKDAVCDRMTDIERAIAAGKIDLKRVHGQADAISTMLMAFPHLFPPSSNQWKPDNDLEPETATLASPDLWTDFPDFYRQAAAAAKTAFELARAGNSEDVKARARALRIACDTCHALYLEEQ